MNQTLTAFDLIRKNISFIEKILFDYRVEINDHDKKLVIDALNEIIDCRRELVDQLVSIRLNDKNKCIEYLNVLRNSFQYNYSLIDRLSDELFGKSIEYNQDGDHWSVDYTNFLDNAGRLLIQARISAADILQDQLKAISLAVYIKTEEVLQEEFEYYISQNPSSDNGELTISDNAFDLGTAPEKLLYLKFSGIYEMIKKVCVDDNGLFVKAKAARVIAHITNEKANNIATLLGKLDTFRKQDTKNTPYKKEAIERAIRAMSEDGLNTAKLEAVYKQFID
jgi:hypothetical protein